MATVIDAVKRLERAGDENSRVTQKLRDAAEELAKLVEDVIGEATGIDLPRGYRVECGSGVSKFFMSRTQGIDDYAGLPIRYAFYPGSSREDPPRACLLQLSADIAEGWLEELAEFLENWNVQNETAADRLIAATA